MAQMAAQTFEVNRTLNWERATPTERLILHFHGVGPIPDWVGLEERNYWCDKQRFELILDDIRALSKAAPIEITFDDGNISDADIALPALVARGMKAAFFVCAGRIGVSGYLDKSALNEIISSGMEIGSHGWQHVDWRRIDDKTLDVEIDGACKRIADVVGCAVDKVAIPFGSYDRRVLRRLRRSDIGAVFTSDGGRAPAVGWTMPREVFRSASWDHGTLVEMATQSPSMKVAFRRSLVSLIKRLR